MTTKEELQKQFDEWVDQGKQLKEQIDALPDDKPKSTGRWKPEIGEEYWSISMKGMITAFDHEEHNELIENEYALANVYRTQEEAQAVLDQQLATVRVLDRIA